MRASLHTTAACAVAAITLTLAAPASADGPRGYHIFATPSYMARTRHMPREPARRVFYYGGSVFSNSKVVSVIWGSNVNGATVATVPGFTAALVNSTYVDQMAEYATHLKGVNGHKGTTQNIGRGIYLGQVQIKPKNVSTSLTNADVQEELIYQIRKGVLPRQDLNTLYMIYFPNNVTINLDGLISCQDFGAYHLSTTPLSKTTDKSIFYAVQPDCNSGLAFIEFAASHEFAEATTDNSPTPGSNPDFPQAWNDKDGFEIGDKCGGIGTLTEINTGKSYTVAQYWLNSKNACSTGNYHSP